MIYTKLIQSCKSSEQHIATEIPKDELCIAPINEPLRSIGVQNVVKLASQGAIDKHCRSDHIYTVSR